jgi:hypothetical protein
VTLVEGKGVRHPVWCVTLEVLVCEGDPHGHLFFLPLFSFLRIDNRDEGLGGNNHTRTEGTDPGDSISV